MCRQMHFIRHVTHTPQTTSLPAFALLRSKSIKGPARARSRTLSPPAASSMEGWSAARDSVASRVVIAASSAAMASGICATVTIPRADGSLPMMVNIWSPALKLPGTFSAVLIGPGLAAPDLPDELKMIVRRLWRDLLVPVIADASALDWLPSGPVPRNTLRVVTPHPGEAGRLLKCSPQQVQANRPHAVREISRRLGDCWVVLKGQQTLLGRSTGDIFINSSGNPHLAQGGSGDVLAGFLAALLAQPALQTDAARTLRYAIWQHGAAADALSAIRANWIVEDLLGEIGKARHLGD